VVALAASATIAAMAPASAGTSFTATQDGDWDDAATWGGAGPPLVVAAGDTVDIPTGIEVTIPAGLTVDMAGALELDGTLDINPAGTLDVGATGTFQNHGLLDIDPRGSVEINAGSFENHASIIMRFSSLAGPPAPSRLLNRDGFFINHGTGHIELGGLLSNSASTQETHMINHGTIDVLRSNFRRGVIGLGGTKRSVLDNHGTITVDDTIRNVSSTAAIYNHPGASLTINPLGDLFVGPGLLINDSTIQNDGDLDNSDGGAIHQLCDGEITGNAVIGADPVDQCDTTPPVISPTTTGTLGDNGWYTTNVTVTWLVTDAESVILEATTCGTTVIGSDHPGITLTCTATSYGGTASLSVTIKRDGTPPVVSASVSPNANSDGWHNTDATVTFSAVDALAGIAACNVPATISSDGANQSATGSCTDKAGNVGTASATGINVDKTPPVVTFGGNAGVYLVSDTVDITCSASDALSGIDTSTCPSASGPAYTFELSGTNVLEASATDVAGNTANAEASFTVEVTEDGVDSVISELVDEPNRVKKLQKLIDKILEKDGSKQQKQFQKFEAYLGKLVGSNALTQEDADALLSLVTLLCECED
jgi:hypothetical protein